MTAFTPSPIPFNDRRTGCIIFGAIEIFAGCLCALVVPLLFFALQIASSDAALDSRLAVLSSSIYGIAAITLVWLGIGSILCRRWARTLLVILSWSWLLVGVVSMAYTPFAMRPAMEELDDFPVLLILILTEVFLAVCFVALPAAMALFYQSKDVRATCEARDPVMRWTDSCPMQLLATSLWLVIGGVTTLALPLVQPTVIPFFGVLVSGFPAVTAIVAFAALSLYLAWGTYHLKLAAWRTTVVATVLFGSSVAITFMRVDAIEFYRRLGYPEQQIEQLRGLGMCSGRNLALATTAVCLAFLGYLLRLKKYFQQPR